MRLAVLTDLASTKAEHLVRSRILISPQDLKSLGSTNGEYVLICNKDKEVCVVVGSLVTLKPGTCMLSINDEGWEELTLKKLPIAISKCTRILFGEKETWSETTWSYIISRLEGVPLSVDSCIGIYLGGLLKILRVVHVEPLVAGVRVTRQTKHGQQKDNNNNATTNEEAFAGLEVELSQLLHLMNECFIPKQNRLFYSAPPRGALLYGPPGTGKTLLVRQAVKNICDCQLLVLTDESSLTQLLYSEADQGTKRIVFLDEIDLFSKEIIQQLIKYMDEDTTSNSFKTFIVACTNKPENVHASLRRPGRLDEEIEIGPPQAAQRFKILKAHLLKLPKGTTSQLTDQAIETISTKCHGFVGADLKLLLNEAIFKCCEKQQSNVLSVLDFEYANSVVSPSCLRQVQISIPKVRWEDVGGLDSIKQAIREAVELPLKHPELFTRLGISPPQGILLYGPPGCSKTMLAKAVATESEMNFISIKGPELLSKWVGDSEKAIQNIFKKAKQSKPCVIFFDEIDALATSRESVHSSAVNNRVTSQLLQELDGVESRTNKVVVLCATNRPDLLDPALLRPGRIDRVIYVRPPAKEERLKIMELSLKSVPHRFPQSRLQELNTEGFSGAEVASICREAALKTLQLDEHAEFVEFEQIKQACDNIKPQIDEKMLQFYENMKF